MHSVPFGPIRIQGNQKAWYSAMGTTDNWRARSACSKEAEGRFRIWSTDRRWSWNPRCRHDREWPKAIFDQRYILEESSAAFIFPSILGWMIHIFGGVIVLYHQRNSVYMIIFQFKLLADASGWKPGARRFGQWINHGEPKKQAIDPNWLSSVLLLGSPFARCVTLCSVLYYYLMYDVVGMMQTACTEMNDLSTSCCHLII